MSTIFAARWVLPVTSPPIRNGGVLIDDGCIVEVESRHRLMERAPDARVLDLGDAAILPGLVDVHVHLELAGLRGYVEDRDFFAWIRRLTRTKYEVLSPDDLVVSAELGVLEATAAGVTTIGEVCDLGTSAAALAASGLRGIVYQEAFGPDPGLVDEAVSRLEERLEAIASVLGRSPRLLAGVSPHAPYSVSAPLFERVARLAVDRHLPMTIHAAESTAESRFLRRGDGPFADFLRGRGIAWSPPGVSTIEYLERLGVLSVRPLLVHCVDVSAQDIERLAALDVPVAHCPKSNAKLAHGVAPLADLERAGIRVGLGTDSVASGNVCDPIDECRHALLSRRARERDGETDDGGARAALRLATLGGAEALGMADRVGSLEPGKRADLCAVGLDRDHLRPVHDPEAAIVWAATARDVVLTAVDGEILSLHGAFTRLDAERIRGRADELRARLDGDARGG